MTRYIIIVDENCSENGQVPLSLLPQAVLDNQKYVRPTQPTKQQISLLASRRSKEARERERKTGKGSGHSVR